MPKKLKGNNFFQKKVSQGVGFLRFGALENPIIFARSTDYRSNYFFKHSKLRKLVKPAEKVNKAYFVNDFWYTNNRTSELDCSSKIEVTSMMKLFELAKLRSTAASEFC